MFGFGKKREKRVREEAVSQPENLSATRVSADPISQGESAFNEDDPRVEYVLAIVERTLALLDYETDVRTGPRGIEVGIPGKPAFGALVIQDVVDELESMGPGDPELAVEAIVDQALLDRTRPSLLDRVDREWRRRIRTQLLNLKHVDGAELPLHRPISEELAVCLAYDEPRRVRPVFEADIAKTSYSLDWLFERGQERTNWESADRVEIGEHACALVGESFTAAKIAGLGELVGAELPAAPLGAIAATPSQRVLGLAPIPENPDGLIAAVNELIALPLQRVDAGDEILTDTLHYWAPDGTLETIAAIRQTGEKSVDVVWVPDTAFSQKYWGSR